MNYRRKLLLPSCQTHYRQVVTITIVILLTCMTDYGLIFKVSEAMATNGIEVSPPSTTSLSAKIVVKSN